MKNKRYAFCAYVAALSTIVILLITGIDSNCFNRSFYESEYAAMNTAEELNMSHEDLMKATNALLDYLQGEQDHIVARITVNGFEREAFNERETKHMVDVLGLYQFALQLRLFAVIALVLSIAYLAWKQRSHLADYLALAYVQCAAAFLMFVALLGIWAAVDFTSLWESFHHLFFTNDLWLLNPHTDLMINMFPEQFFFHMVLRIVIGFIIGFCSIGAVSIWYLRKAHCVNLQKEEKAI